MPLSGQQSLDAPISAQDTRPIYVQIASELRDSIGSGTLAEDSRAPSIHELSRFHSVNPTTSSKALALLVAEGLLEKRRGLGMFVVTGARVLVQRRRREAIAQQFIAPLIAEAKAIDLGPAEVHELIDLHWKMAVRHTEAGPEQGEEPGGTD